MTKILFSLWLLSSIALWIYSYGFVDFNLTLSSHPLVMGFVSWTQSLALFNRPLSLNVYLALVCALYVLYFLALRHSNIQTIKLWHFIIPISLIFALAYPLLSSDVFKYLFSARMVVEYGANPHVLPPNTFPDDTWIRFMRWVHTPSPYGPVMTALAIPPYIVSLGKFVPALYLFKGMCWAFYLLSVFLVGRLARFVSKDPSAGVRAQLFFALNQLILVEWLSNAHNDGPMITLFLASLYFLLRQEKIKSIGTLLLSVGIKYVTVVLLPFIFLKKLKPSTMYSVLLTGFALAPLLYHYSYQYQPWYVTWLIPLAAALGSVPVMILVGSYTVGSFLRYIPFISSGLWEGESWQFALYSFGLPLLALFLLLIRRYLRST